ncbi:MAG TPA: hypothetical protein VG325_19560 [Solirubrobacteraceae bacterium]|nr:hypothetical protein [Solirubrobacteraceae bacterium]
MRFTRFRWSIVLPAALGVLGLAGCGQSAPTRHGNPTARAVVAHRPAAQPTTGALARWTARVHVRGVVDLGAPMRDGSMVVAARGHLQRLSSRAALTPFAPGYSAPPGLEPYIVRSQGVRAGGGRCSFAADRTYALRLRGGDGVTVVTAGGAVRRFAALPSRGLENGIAFDQTGRFGHRLLTTTLVSGRTVLSAIDCRGRVRVVTAGAPRAEGGLAIAPAGFGRFGGDLIAPDELSGNLYAIAPDGRVAGVIPSGLPHGQDVGVESEGFVPRSFKDALVADRHTPGNRHPGDDLILGVSRAALQAAGVRPGDLLAVTEGGAETIDIRCQASCRVGDVAAGPGIAHIEGHVVFSGTI